MPKKQHRRGGINWNDRKNCWIIDKTWRKQRVYIITETDCPDEAEILLDNEVNQIRQAVLHGKRPTYLFLQGAERYLEEMEGASTFEKMQKAILRLMPFIGKTPIQKLDTNELKKYIKHRKKEGKKTRKKDRKTGKFYEVRRPLKNATINRELEIVRAISRLAASEWICKHTEKFWTDFSPIIKMLPEEPKKGNKKDEHSAEAYSLSWAQQDKLFPLLSERLQRMCLFKVNTGTREQEVCLLRWGWEYDVPELDTTLFIVPRGYVKNGEARVIVLNSIARSIIEEQRQQWEGVSEFVFPNPNAGGDQPYSRMQTSSWVKGWVKAGLPDDPWTCQGVHNLKHTCGRRLRAADIPRETRKVCLGHSDGDITTHYSAAEIKELLDAMETLCNRREGIVARPRFRTVSGRKSGSTSDDLRQSYAS